MNINQHDRNLRWWATYDERSKALDTLFALRRAGEELTEQVLIDTLKGKSVWVYTYANTDNTVREYHCVKEGYSDMAWRIGDGHSFTGTKANEGIVYGQTLWLRERNADLAVELFRQKNLERAEEAQKKADRCIERIA